MLIESGEWGSPLPIPNEEKKEGETEGLSPPNSLLAFPVVASLVNGILSSFNELRNSASMLIGKGLGERLQEHLETLPNALNAYRNGRPDEVLAETQGRYNELCELLANVFLPYIRKCFDHIFELETNYSTLALNSKDRISSFLQIETIQNVIYQFPIYPKTQPLLTSNYAANGTSPQENEIPQREQVAEETESEVEQVDQNDSEVEQVEQIENEVEQVDQNGNGVEQVDQDKNEMAEAGHEDVNPVIPA